MESMDMLDWDIGSGTTGNYGVCTGSTSGSVSGAPGGESMMVDEDYMELMTDTLFSTISSNQPIYFPDPREIGNISQSIEMSDTRARNVNVERERERLFFCVVHAYLRSVAHVTFVILSSTPIKFVSASALRSNYTYNASRRSVAQVLCT